MLTDIKDWLDLPDNGYGDGYRYGHFERDVGCGSDYGNGCGTSEGSGYGSDYGNGCGTSEGSGYGDGYGMGYGMGNGNG